MTHVTAETITKDALIDWLYEHGKLTADLELDIHDNFDAALPAAAAAQRDMPGVGRFASGKKRMQAFLAACAILDARPGLESSEAMVALCILRMLSPEFRKAIAEFDHHAPTFDSEEVEALPGLARAYLEVSRDFNTPLVAG
ncbi:hypothetical protein [Desulfocurvus sp. DL9XJH121]